MYITTNREQITETLREMFQKIQKHYNRIANSKEYEISIENKHKFDDTDEDNDISRLLRNDNEVVFIIKKLLNGKHVKPTGFFSKIFNLNNRNKNDNDKFKRTVIYQEVNKEGMIELDRLGISGFHEVYLFAYFIYWESKYNRFKTNEDIIELCRILDWDLDEFNWLDYYSKFVYLTQMYKNLDKPFITKNPFAIKRETEYNLFSLIGLTYSDATFNDKYIDVRRSEDNNVQFVIKSDNKEVVFDLVFDETPNEKMIKNMLLILADHTKINGIKVSEITNVRDEVFANGNQYLSVNIDKQNKLVQILLRSNESTVMRTLSFSDFKARSSVNDLFLDAFPKTIISAGTDEELAIAANISEISN